MYTIISIIHKEEIIIRVSIRSDRQSVLAFLKELQGVITADDSETLFDTDDDKPPLLFVFGKDIIKEAWQWNAMV